MEITIFRGDYIENHLSTIANTTKYFFCICDTKNSCDTYGPRDLQRTYKNSNNVTRSTKLARASARRWNACRECRRSGFYRRGLYLRSFDILPSLFVLPRH